MRPTMRSPTAGVAFLRGGGRLLVALLGGGDDAPVRGEVVVAGPVVRVALLPPGVGPPDGAGRPGPVVHRLRLRVEHGQAGGGVRLPLLPALAPEGMRRIGVVLIVVRVLVALLAVEVRPALPPHLIMVELDVRAVVAVEHALVTNCEDLLVALVLLLRPLVEDCAAVANFLDVQLLLHSASILQPIQRAMGVPKDCLDWVWRRGAANCPALGP
mmetsp:Transcript_22933/g.47591  ORF Transcript_22933/g.47591 Transcript_22933/m.47591 type:complete len:214 (-) Transcript_22933:184-825(-)